VQFKQPAASVAASAPIAPKAAAKPQKQENFFRTMTAEEYKTFSQAVKDAPQPSKLAAAATAAAVERTVQLPIKEQVVLPKAEPVKLPPLPPLPPMPAAPAAPLKADEPEPEQVAMEAMPQDIPWRYVGELYNSYILVEQGENAFLIDKHAAHERILFEKLKANQEAISAQALLTPIPCRMGADSAAILLTNKSLLEELGFEVDEFGDNTVLLRQIPMDLDPEQAASAIEELAADLMNGRRESKTSVRDEMLHTVACKAAIKAGWQSSEKELLVLVEQVMSREDLKHCPHGRPICISLSKKQLEKQFKRS
jgi:DNA mismatch repair protein MutL